MTDDAPNSKTRTSSDCEEARPPVEKDAVQRVIDLMRTAILADGGDVELVDVQADGVVSVRFHGACVGCPSSSMTLQSGIERNLRQHVPGVTQVIAVD